MKSWYVPPPELPPTISKPALYCASDNGCFADGADSLTFCLRALFRVLRVAIWSDTDVYPTIEGKDNG